MSTSSGKVKRTVGPYIVTGRIGSGSFAHVYVGYHKDKPDLQVAIKSIDRKKLLENKKYQESMDKEIAIMKQLQHTNIVCLYETTTTDRHIYLIMEYCAGGDLAKHIRKMGVLPEDLVKRLVYQLAIGVKHLTDKGLIHRDLKPQNLLLTTKSLDDPKCVLKIADFGFARALEPHMLAATLCGSPLYMAPEILRHQRYDHRADLWSIGAIMYQMLTGKPPFSASHPYQLLQVIDASPQPITLPVFNLSSTCTSIVQQLLQRNPGQRLSPDQFFRHPFVGLLFPQPLQPPPLLNKSVQTSPTPLVPPNQVERKTQSNYTPGLLSRLEIAILLESCLGNVGLESKEPETPLIVHLHILQILSASTASNSTLTPNEQDVFQTSASRVLELRSQLGKTVQQVDGIASILYKWITQLAQHGTVAEALGTLDVAQSNYSKCLALVAHLLLAPADWMPLVDSADKQVLHSWHKCVASRLARLS